MFSDAKRFVRKNKIFSVIFAFAIIIRIALLSQQQDLWWDSGVYAGMGKFIFSLGKSGLWEHIRPVLFPFFLGFFWKINLDLVAAGKMLELVLSCCSIVLLYLIAKEVFDRKTAILASAIFSFSSVFLFMNFQLYTEVPAVFLVLAGLYSYIKEKNLLAGVFLGLAFLAKFPSGIFFAILFAVILFSKEFEKLPAFCAGFAVIALPFFVINQIAYGNFFLPLADAKAAIGQVLGCNYLWRKPWQWYFSFILLKENFLHLFSIAGIYYFLKKPNKNKAAIFFFLLLPFAYFLQMNCRDWRYLVVVIPFFSIFTASGISRKIRQKENFMPLLAVILVLSASISLGFYYENKGYPSQAEQDYLHFLEFRQAEGEIWSSNPLAAVYSDEKINKIYYPVFNYEAGDSFYSYLKKNSGNVEYVFLDSCGGGIICLPEDSECSKNLGYIYSYLGKNFDLVYNETSGVCTYRIYKNKLF
ncbi:glycosyltransferase family 39 protein [Candidatus Woesearchaeota archaeon]|nr:glycosyltransferase family 39 protein [Candidatus Woesearchaeota archaeon]